MPSLTSGQPKAVWAVFFSCIIAFMGLGLVDPILPSIAGQLGASPSQVALLFTSYNAIMAVAMLITGVVASRLGTKGTLLTGIVVIATFSLLGGFSNNIWVLVGLRGGWGLGNALFVATALTAIVTLSRGGTAKAIILYEAAIGLGISVGPILGGVLGGISWRGPFLGVGALMVLAFLFLVIFMPGMEKGPTPVPKAKTSWLDPFRALRHRALFTLGLTAFLYNFGFFTLMAYSPFVMGLDAHGIGWVFLGWGVLLALTSVFVAPVLKRRFGTIASMAMMLTLFALDLGLMGAFAHVPWVIMACVVAAGALLGNNNTLITTAVMNSAPVERSTASAAYSFLRFIGGAVAPFLAGWLAEVFSPPVPFFVGGAFVLGAVVLVLTQRKHLALVDSVEDSGHRGPETQAAVPSVTVGQLMNRQVFAVTRQTPVAEVLELLTQHRLDGIPVVDDQRRLVGMVGAGAVIRSLYPREKTTYDLFFTTLVTEAEDEMTILKDKVQTPVGALEVVPHPRHLAEGDSLETAVRLLSKHRLREVPVVDAEGRIAGMLARSDLTRQMAQMVVDRSRSEESRR
jgi:predicted MFS family arabinose efflux permease/CBS domain-containing protein